MSQISSSAVTEQHVLRGIICALGGGLCWGFSGTCAQLLMREYGAPAAWITCIRMVIAAVFFLLITAVKDWRDIVAVFRDIRSLVQIILFAIFGVLLSQLTYLNAIEYAGAGTGTVIEQLGLIVILAYACIRTKRHPTLREAIGLIFALAGTALIATQGNISGVEMPFEGLVWGLLAALGLAFYTLIPVRVLRKWGSLLVTGLAMLFGGVFASAVINPWATSVELSVPALTALVAIVLIGTLGAYMLYLQGVSDAGPVRASLLCCVEPVSAMVISALWLKTDISVWDVAGCVCIVVMIFLVTGGAPQLPQESSLGLPDAQLEGKVNDAPLFAGRASVLGYYTCRKAERGDFSTIKALLDEGHRFFAELGIVEGRKKYPSSRRLMHSIKNGTTHVVIDARGALIAVFGVSFFPDKNYSAGSLSGNWLSDTSAKPQRYAELHWITVTRSARRRGVGMFILQTADRLARNAGMKSIRADVYVDNDPTQYLLQKHGYHYCGTLTISDVFGRIKLRKAFERLL